jgi:hypothetical protein
VSAEVIQQVAVTVPVAGVALARLRLEDVFLRLVAADAQDTHALRADLQGLHTGAALV